MFTFFKKTKFAMAAAMTMGMMTTQDAFAQATPGNAGGNTFSDIAANITGSIQDVPGLLTAVSYLLGLLLGVLGVLKIKDHVENPNNAPLKEGAIRLAAGGALFALPILFEAMFETVGSDGANVNAAVGELFGEDGGASGSL